LAAFASRAGKATSLPGRDTVFSVEYNLQKKGGDNPALWQQGAISAAPGDIP